MVNPFLWGVASSGYQCEGGYNGPGQPQNNWTHAEASGAVMRTGHATDFWNRYAEDFQNCRQMGLRAFRLSIEWARAQPTTSPTPHTPPPFDEEALEHYSDIIASCISFNLQPILTLHHFTHPAWLGTDAWLNDATPALFAEFAQYAIKKINLRLIERHKLSAVRWVVTINEPNMLVLNTYLNRHFPSGGRMGMGVGVEAYNRLLAAHVRAYNAIHDLYVEEGWGEPMVAMNTFCSDAYWSENMLLDLLFLRERGVGRGDLRAHFREGARALRCAMRDAVLPFMTDPFVWVGRMVHHLIDWAAPRHATEATFAYFLDELERSPRSRVQDFLGLDYYDPFIGHLFRPPSFADLEFASKGLTGHLMAGLSRKWWDWHALPEGLHFFCTYYARRFPGLGILIAENGMAMRCKPDGSLTEPRRDRLSRSAFLEAHTAQINRLRREGVPMLGYLHWSITDNYEWGSFTPRFGLYCIDYTDGARRCAVDHHGDNPPATYRRIIAENP
jgi:beta-glucosidase